jgi:hypothetical protein
MIGVYWFITLVGVLNVKNIGKKKQLIKKELEKLMILIWMAIWVVCKKAKLQLDLMEKS